MYSGVSVIPISYRIWDRLNQKATLPESDCYIYIFNARNECLLTRNENSETLHCNFMMLNQCYFNTGQIII